VWGRVTGGCIIFLHENVNNFFFAPNIRATELKRMKLVGYVTLVCGMRLWMCDACLWNDNVDV
jgi:hypothetical protein